MSPTTEEHIEALKEGRKKEEEFLKKNPGIKKIHDKFRKENGMKKRD